MIPLAPEDISNIWKAIKPYSFHTTYGVFKGQDVRDKDLKQRVLESMKTQIRSEGWKEHALLEEEI